MDIPKQTWRFADILFGGGFPENIERLEIVMLLTGDNCKTIPATMRLHYQGLDQGMVFE